MSDNSVKGKTYTFSSVPLFLLIAVLTLIQLPNISKSNIPVSLRQCPLLILKENETEERFNSIRIKDRYHFIGFDTDFQITFW